MTAHERVEMALDLATVNDDWKAASKLIVWCFEEGYLNIEGAAKYTAALRRMIACQENRSHLAYAGPRYRAHLAEKPLSSWAKQYKK